MRYSNPEIPEGINVSKRHPLKEFIILTSGVIGCIFIVVFILSLMAEKLAVHVPFSTEREMTSSFMERYKSDGKMQTYLQTMADGLAADMNLPEDMSITVHYVDDNVKNAYATLGGHIFIHQGLIGIIPNENALAMVLAHEIAHIKHRHPIIAMGRGVVLGLLFSAISGISSNKIVGDAVNSAGMIAVMNFSRDQEREADKTGIIAVAKYYGHVAGALDLFRALLKYEGKNRLSVPAFLSTHPLDKERIAGLTRYAKEHGWQMDREVRALPGFVRDR
ncbi:MAG: M48 family metallopeptidase [Gammaproteobacteria bacterium]